MSRSLDVFPCDHMGSQLGGAVARFSWKRLRWVATKPILSVFGAEVQGELRAEAFTKRRALAKLEKQEHDHYESLWI